MAIQDYMSNDDAGKKDLFLHVKVTLPTFFNALNITAATQQVAQQAADADAFAYVCIQQQALQGAAQNFTKTKNRLRDGDKLNPNVAVSLAFPSAPGVIPSPVLPGVVTRFRLFVKWLRSLAGYTPAMGEALKIIGDEETEADTSLLKPVLPASLSGGRVELGWKWGDAANAADALEILVDRGDGKGYVFLTIDTRPGYVDTEPLPATAAKWKYKAIWRKDDTRIGLWSDEVSITVGA